MARMRDRSPLPACGMDACHYKCIDMGLAGRERGQKERAPERPCFTNVFTFDQAVGAREGRVKDETRHDLENPSNCAGLQGSSMTLYRVCSSNLLLFSMT